MMSLHIETTTRAARSDILGRPYCPECAAQVVAPERSAFVGEDRVRHSWLCDECGTAFASFAAFGAYRG